MKKKARDILPYHIAFNLVAFCIGLLRGHSIAEIINRIGCFFFLPVFGFNGGQWMLGAEWYIGYMLFAMLVIFVAYMLIEKNLFMKIVAPVCSIAFYGYIAAYCDILISGNHMVRAFAGILLGFTVYQLAGMLWQRMESGKDNEDSSHNNILMSLLRLYPVIVIVLFIVYVNTTIELSVQPMIVLILASGLTVTFAEEGLFSHSQIMNNKFVFWLGKMSLPIYMIQNITRMVAQTLLKNKSVGLVFVAEFVVTICGGIAAYYVWQAIKSKFDKLKTIRGYRDD